MILISPRGKEREFTEDKGKKILSSPLKIKQGWKLKPKPKAKPKSKAKKTESKSK